jgi:uncharacterized protein YbjT (DUF2867 family)
MHQMHLVKPTTHRTDESLPDRYAAACAHADRLEPCQEVALARSRERAAAPNTGVNTLTGGGLNETLAGAAVVVDVSNSPSFEDAAVLELFESSTRNVLQVEAATGVGHHVALSVIGNDRISDSGY